MCLQCNLVAMVCFQFECLSLENTERPLKWPLPVGASNVVGVNDFDGFKTHII
jgi:hypothetical protein